MAVVRVIEQSHLRTGSISLPPAADSVRIFLVYTSAATDDDSVALVAVDPTTSLAIPSPRDPHPTRTWLFCTSIACRQVDEKAGRCWEVTVTYTLDWEHLPWNEPAVFSGSQNSVDRIADFPRVKDIEVLGQPPVRQWSRTVDGRIDDILMGRHAKMPRVPQELPVVELSELDDIQPCRVAPTANLPKTAAPRTSSNSELLDVELLDEGCRAEARRLS